MILDERVWNGKGIRVKQNGNQLTANTLVVNEVPEGNFGYAIQHFLKVYVNRICVSIVVETPEGTKDVIGRTTIEKCGKLIRVGRLRS